MDSVERQHHVQVTRGEVGRYVLLPGDPGRCEPIARWFDEPRLVARNREFETWSGYLEGELVSVTSTGIGSPSAVIAVEELVKAGADTFIRVGTSGAVDPNARTGELAVITAAIRDEGTSSHYLPVEFPAAADIDVSRALVVGARAAGAVVHVGISHSTDSFFSEMESARMPLAHRISERSEAWKAGGTICAEMEAAALFIGAATLRVRAGAIALMIARDTEDMTAADQAALAGRALIPAAIAGLRELIAQDAEVSA